MDGALHATEVVLASGSSKKFLPGLSFGDYDYNGFDLGLGGSGGGAGLESILKILGVIEVFDDVRWLGGC